MGTASLSWLHGVSLVEETMTHVFFGLQHVHAPQVPRPHQRTPRRRNGKLRRHDSATPFATYPSCRFALGSSGTIGGSGKHRDLSRLTDPFEPRTTPICGVRNVACSHVIRQCGTQYCRATWRGDSTTSGVLLSFR